MKRSHSETPALSPAATAACVLTLAASLTLVPTSALAGRNGGNGSGDGGGYNNNGYNQSGQATIYALTAGNQLICFNSNEPSRIRNRFTVTNLQVGEQLLGIDFRPANGWLYGVGSTSQVYLIDTRNGVASRIGAPFTPALNGTDFGVDFNPVVDRLRIVSNTGQNLRVHPDLGTVVGNDGALAYAAGDANAGRQPSVVGAAYSNPDNDVNTGTALYDIDVANGVLSLQNPPNNGTLMTIGALNVASGNLVGFDIGPTNGGYQGGYGGSGSQGGYNGGYGGLAAFQLPGTTNSQLYSVDLVTGRATNRGQIGAGESIKGLAIQLPNPSPAGGGY